MDNLKMIVEKYCPVVSRNVAVEISGGGESACCLHKGACGPEHGECKNRFLNENRK